MFRTKYLNEIFDASVKDEADIVSCHELPPAIRRCFLFTKGLVGESEETGDQHLNATINQTAVRFEWRQLDVMDQVLIQFSIFMPQRANFKSFSDGWSAVRVCVRVGGLQDSVKRL